MSPLREQHATLPCSNETQACSILTAQTPLTDYGKDKSFWNVETGYGVLPSKTTVHLLL